MDYYYLEMNYYIKENGKKKLDTIDLYNAGKLIKSFNKEETQEIRKKIIEQNIDVKKIRDSRFIDNQLFIKHVLRTVNSTKKRKPVNKKMIGFVVGTTLLALVGVNKSTNNKNVNNNTTSIVVEAAENNEDDFKDMDVIEVTEKTYNYENEKTDNNVSEDTEVTDTEKLDATIIYESNDISQKSIIDNGFENIFEFSYEDRSNSENVAIVNNDYSYLIDVYSKRYGIDSKLMTAIICQENPTNQSNPNFNAGHGVPQIESIWNNNVVCAFNYDINQIESSKTIDVMRCEYDQDYSIRLGCMIINNYYNSIHENYGYKLTKEQELSATVWAYNKGITAINNGLRNTDTYEDFVEYVKYNSIGGDNEYVEHVFSYIPDEEIITMKTRDGLLNSVMIDNTTVENHKKPATL